MEALLALASGVLRGRDLLDAAAPPRAAHHRSRSAFQRDESADLTAGGLTRARPPVVPEAQQRSCSRTPTPFHKRSS